MDDFDRYLQDVEDERRAERREVWIGMLEAAGAFWPAMLLLVIGFNPDVGLRALGAVRAFFALVVSHV